MAQWDLFVAVTALVVVLLLVLSRRSQRTIERYSETQQESATADQPLDGADLDDESEQTLPHEHTEGDDESEQTLPHEHIEEDDWTYELDDLDDRAEGQTRASEKQLTSGVMMANVAVTQGLVVLVISGAAWLFAIPATAFGVGPASVLEGGRMAALGVVFGALLWAGNELSTTVADAVGAAYDERVRSLLAPSTTQGWAVLFGGVLPVIAIAEELLFRAALIGVPDAAGYGIPVWLLVGIASLAFALGHGAQGRVGIVVTGVLGVVLAAGYVLSGSLLLVVVAHYVINALEFLLHELLGFEGFEKFL